MSTQTQPLAGQAPPEIDWQNDPDFHNLPLPEKHKALLAVDSGYKGLPPAEQAKALNTIHYGEKGTQFEQEREGAPKTTGEVAKRALTAPFTTDFWKQAGEAGKGLLPGLFNPTTTTAMTPSGAETMRGLGSQIGGEDVQRKAEGRSPAYRGVAALGSTIGVPARQMEQQADIGKPEGVMGAAAPITALAASPLLERGAEAIGGKLAPKMAERTLAKSTREIKEAAPPGRQEINYDAQLQRARPYLAEEQRRVPVKSVREAYEAANSAVKGIEAKIGGYIDQLPETDRVSGQDILARATEKLNDPNSPRSPAERAAGIRALEEFLTDEMPAAEEGGEPSRVPKDLSVKEADRLRWRFNRDMDSEMGMTEADRADVRASNPKFAAKEAAAEALRDGVYDKLEQAGVPGVREIRGDEGAVIQQRDAYRRNITRAEKSNAPSAMRRLGVFGPIGLGFLGETLGSHIGLPQGASAAAGLGTAALYEWGRNRMRPNPLMERGFGRLGKSTLAPNYPEMPVRGETANEPPAPVAAQAPPVAAAPEAPRPLAPEPMAPTPQSPVESPKLAVNKPLTTKPKAGRTAKAKPAENPAKLEKLEPGKTPAYVQAIANEVGVQASGYQPGDGPGMGWFQFQDPETGGSVYLREGQVSAQALKEKLATHRGEVAATPPEGKSDVGQAKQEAVEARQPEEPEPTQKTVQEEFSPEQLEDAELGIRQELEMRQSGDRPGRYYSENPQGEYNPQREQSSARGVTSGGHWIGIKGPTEGGFPVTAGFGPMEIEVALRRKAGRVYDRLIRRAVRPQEEVAKATGFNPGLMEPEGVLPGMGEHVAAQKEGAARVLGEGLTAEMNRPMNINEAAGEMERKSELFRGTEASPQRELLPPRETPKPKKKVKK